jgi:Tfp pilus assembly protein PilF
MTARSHRLAPVLGLTMLALVALLVVETRISGHHVDLVSVDVQPTVGQRFVDDGPGDAPGGDSAGPLHDQARTLARRGLLDEALEGYTRVVRAQPRQGSLRAEQGYWLLVAGRDDEALVALERAAELEPRVPWVAMLLGRARLRVGDGAGAEHALQRAVDLDPRSGEARLALAGVILERGRVSEAAQLFADLGSGRGSEQAALALAGLGRAKLALGDTAGGQRALQLAVERAPGSVGLRVCVARTLIDTGQPEDLVAAVALLDGAALLAPELPRLHSLRGQALELSGELDRAGLAYLEALRLDPDAADARARLQALEPDPELLLSSAGGGR